MLCLAVRASARQQKKRDSYEIHTTYKSAIAKQPEISRPGNTFVAANVAQTRTKDSTNPYPVIGRSTCRQNSNSESNQSRIYGPSSLK